MMPVEPKHPDVFVFDEMIDQFDTVGPKGKVGFEIACFEFIEGRLGRIGETLDIRQRLAFIEFGFPGLGPFHHGLEPFLEMGGLGLIHVIDKPDHAFVFLGETEFQIYLGIADDQDPVSDAVVEISVIRIMGAIGIDFILIDHIDMAQIIRPLPFHVE